MQDNNRNKTHKGLLLVLIITLVISMGALFVALKSNHSIPPIIPSAPVEVSMPYSLSDFEKMDYKTAKSKFESAGFKNIKCISETKKFNIVSGALNNIGKKIDTGDIKEIVIDQTIKKFKKGDTFLSDSEIVITYYNVVK